MGYLLSDLIQLTKFKLKLTGTLSGLGNLESEARSICFQKLGVEGASRRNHSAQFPQFPCIENLCFHSLEKKMSTSNVFGKIKEAYLSKSRHLNPTHPDPFLGAFLFEAHWIPAHCQHASLLSHSASHSQFRNPSWGTPRHPRHSSVVDHSAGHYLYPLMVCISCQDAGSLEAKHFPHFTLCFQGLAQKLAHAQGSGCVH